MTEEERERRVQISKDALNKDVGFFGRRVSEAFFREGTITESEFYSAIGLYRIELELIRLKAKIKK
ncbi:unnamed protein product [marine sediment metagenome]|uniref:Antitoxin VbhA domain-containing protein n=1 Tax=marine sediment metagenome TaxID=412755 RepID=X1IXL2_9ZZZZ